MLIACDARLEGDVDDLGQRQVEGVRAFVVAPADVQPHPVGRQALGRGVERRDVALGDLAAEFVVGQVAVLVVAAEPRSGQSICSTKPASTIARYSVFIISASAST